VGRHCPATAPNTYAKALIRRTYPHTRSTIFRNTLQRQVLWITYERLIKKTKRTDGFVLWGMRKCRKQSSSSSSSMFKPIPNSSHTWHAACSVMHYCFTFGRFHVRNQTAECLVVLLSSSGKRWEIFQNTRWYSLLVKTAVCTGLHWLSSIPFQATWHKKLTQRCKLQTAAEREYRVNEARITIKPIKNTGFPVKTHNFSIKQICYMFLLLFCNHHQADPKNVKRGKSYCCDTGRISYDRRSSVDFRYN
jgi:hypothetical protein